MKGKHSLISRQKMSLAHKGKPSWNKGKTLSEEHRKNLSLSHKGKNPWNKGKKTGLIPKTAFKKGSRSSISTEFKKGFTPWNKDLKGYHAGEKHHNWQGGITSLTMKIRRSFEMKRWTRAVLKRDKHICQECGAKEHLEAHHIKSFSNYPELRFVLKNGITLCRECHQRTNNYGGREVKQLCFNY